MCSILANAAIVKGGVESVCETMVSVMEYHCSAIKGLTRQERIEDEVR